MKIAYQGIAGSYSESCAKKNYPNAETIPCRTFQDAFELAKNDSNINIVELRNYLLKKCHSKNIFLRPIWQLISEQKMYKDMPSDEIIVAKDIVSRVISLPSSPQLLEQ